MFFFSNHHGYNHGFGNSCIGFPTHFVLFISSSFPSQTRRFSSVVTRPHLKICSTCKRRATILVFNKADRPQPEEEPEEVKESNENSCSTSSSHRLSSGPNNGNVSKPSRSLSTSRGHGDMPSSSSSSPPDGNSSVSSASQGKPISHESYSSTWPSTSGKGNGASLELGSNSLSSMSARNNSDHMAAPVTGTRSSPIPKQVNYISTGIKAAFEVFQGWKMVQKLRTPSAAGVLHVGLGAGNWLLLSVNVGKFLVKGLRVSEKVWKSTVPSKLIFKGHPEGVIVERVVNKDLASAAKGFNAFYGAMKIVKFAKGWGSKVHVAKIDGDVIWNSYKLSKNLVTVVDAVVGRNGWASAYVGKGFVFVKKTVGGIGVIVKGAFLSKELCMALLNKLAMSGGTLAVLLGRDFRKDQNERVMHGRPLSKQTRMSCMMIRRGVNGSSNLVLVPSLMASISSKSLHSFSQAASVELSEENDLCSLFCLAIPVTEEVLVVS